jgi:hypothetical protein
MSIVDTRDTGLEVLTVDMVLPLDTAMEVLTLDTPMVYTVRSVDMLVGTQAVVQNPDTAALDYMFRMHTDRTMAVDCSLFIPHIFILTQ